MGTLQIADFSPSVTFYVVKGTEIVSLKSVYRFIFSGDLNGALNINP
jgi:hypothetical protein